MPTFSNTADARLRNPETVVLDGAKIRELRIAKRISQRKLAAEAHLSSGYMSQIENNQIDAVGIPIASRIARTLGTDIATILAPEPVADIATHSTKLLTPVDTGFKNMHAGLDELQKCVADSMKEFAISLITQSSAGNDEIARGHDKGARRTDTAVLGDAVFPEWAAELESLGGTMWALIGGLPLEILPEFSSYEDERLKEFANDPLVLVRMRARFHRKAMMTKYLREAQRRYLIPKATIQRYAEEGKPRYDEFEAARIGWAAKESERVERLEKLIELLKHPNFELGLLDSDDSPINFTIHNHTALLIRLRLGERHEEVPYNGIVIKTFKSKVIERFEFNHKMIWDGLPLAAKDKDLIRSWLEGLIRTIR